MKKIPSHIKIYGDQSYRNKKCPHEANEQVTFINRVRAAYPETYGKILLHPKNEGQKKDGQFASINKDKAMGHLTKGASDIIIPGSPAFVCELKRRDITLREVTDEQIEYLTAAQNVGAFACVALGADAATEAFNDWLNICKKDLTSKS